MTGTAAPRARKQHHNAKKDPGVIRGPCNQTSASKLAPPVLCTEP